MRRRLLTIALTAILALGMFGGAAAQGHGGGCSGFGAAISASGQAGGHGATVSSVAGSGPGAVSNYVQTAHGLLCD
jgi:hypothetical protein